VYDFYSKKYHNTFCNSCCSTSIFIWHVQLKPILGTTVAVETAEPHVNTLAHTCVKQHPNRTTGYQGMPTDKTSNQVWMGPMQTAAIKCFASSIRPRTHTMFNSMMVTSCCMVMSIVMGPIKFMSN
jgi:hypothetical protein